MIPVELKLMSHLQALVEYDTNGFAARATTFATIFKVANMTMKWFSCPRPGMGITNS